MLYKDTLNLPKTDFPMKAKLTQKEPERIKWWQNLDIYSKILNERDESKKYILHDGPPYANGHIHMGHALNKILKDIIVKIKLLEGYYSPYIPGWDCHGLPIEHQVDKQLGSKKSSLSKAEIRKKCRDYAEKYIDIQRKEFIRLGVFGDWYNPYITMDYTYESIIVRELYKFFENKGVIRSSKPVYWCASCVTALAEAEVEYYNHKSPSIFVKFEADLDTNEKLNIDKNKKIYFVIWTTTPWTLPANLAIAVHPNFNYAFINILKTNNKNLDNNTILVIEEELAKNIVNQFGVKEYKIEKIVNGKQLENLEAIHPFYNRKSKLILADHVTKDQGTGLVHTAPGHGLEDYIIGLKYNLEAYNPVDDYGNFNKELELFGGINVFEANNDILEYIDENRSLVFSHTIEHQYPHCWRCKKPVIYRATPQWFISMNANDLRKRALDEIRKVKWIPSWGMQRIYSMIENRPDWCISRQRSWGVPIAVLICKKCGHYYTDKNLQDKVVELFQREGADAWFEYPIETFTDKDVKCTNCGSRDFRKEDDILDVWFDSGSSHAAVCENRKELNWPANMYLEGSDQHRGWFHSSLLESVGTRGKAPYKEVLTHGFVVDGKGRKMSKSYGNVITPFDIVDKHGAEILRLWVSAEDYSEDIRLSQDILQRLVESYRKIRNTARYMLGNIYDFNPDNDYVSFKDMLELDRYILIKWQNIKKRIYNAFDEYQFHIFYHTLLNFCINSLSSFYIDVLKDRLYCESSNSLKRKSAQTAIFTIIKEFCILISPILSFTAEELWEYLPNFKNKKTSVFLETFPKIESYIDNELLEKVEFILTLKDEVNKHLEEARKNKIIGHSLDAEIELQIGKEYEKFLNIDETLERIFLVSKASVIYSNTNERIIKVNASKAPKCERCWNHSDTVNEDNLCSRCFNVLNAK
ncbi:MAG: isoleucine--tRNA ligase [Deferribacterota bacterium]|nr:isoleucine--tRNA ligase [Deferribacterota bacterium]